MPSRQKQSATMPGTLKLFIVLCFCSFIVYALYFNIIGANATMMMQFYQITEAQQGFILTLQSVGALAATIVIAFFGERYNKIHVIVFGLLLLGLGGLVIGLAPTYAQFLGKYQLLLAMALVAGIGFTCIDIMVNSTLTDVYPNQSKTLIPAAHAAHGVGMMLSPLLVVSLVNTQQPSSFSIPYFWIGLATIVVFIALALSAKRITPHTPYTEQSEIRKKAAENPAEIFKTKECWIILLACVTYFAFQTGISAWLPSFSMQYLQADYSAAGRMVTYFFGGALVMRLITPLLLKRWSAKQLYVLFGLVSSILTAFALFSTSTLAAIVFITLAGFLQGAHSVLLVMMSCAVFPTRTSSATSLITMGIGIASFIFPVLMGALAEDLGFRMPLLLITIVLAISSLTIFLLGRKHKLA